MGKDQGFFRIGPYSRRGLVLGIILGIVVTGLSILFIRYTQQLFIASILWLVSIPFIMWLVRKFGRSEYPGGEGLEDEGE